MCDLINAEGTLLFTITLNTRLEYNFIKKK